MDFMAQTESKQGVDSAGSRWVSVELKAVSRKPTLDDVIRQLYITTRYYNCMVI